MRERLSPEHWNLIERTEAGFLRDCANMAADAEYAPSEALAALLTRWDEAGRSVCFLIGGAEGLDPAVQARAEYRLSLGPLTWPHFLVRGMLAEQLYRAQAIRTGHPYHRTWRP